MEDEIDLGKYFKVLIRHWKLIIGLAISASVAALVVSSFPPPTYEATALIVVTRLRNQYEFDPRIQTQFEQQPYRAYPALALTDNLLTRVIAALGDQLKIEERDPAALRERLSAGAGIDPSLVRLSVTANEPQQAQTLANIWASLYVTYTNELYQQRSSSAIFFETQAAEAQNRLATAEQALVDYQAKNPLNLVTAQLNSKQAEFGSYLAANRTITLVIQDARSLQQQLTQQNVNSPSSLSDQLSALYMQVDALNAGANVPIQLQLSGAGSLSDRTVAEQAALLGTLIEALQDKSIEIQRQIKALEPDILALQKAQQAAQVEFDRLTRERDVAKDTYLTLTRKVTETDLAAQDSGGGVQLASEASLPTEPVSTRKGLNAILGGFLGLVLGIICAFVIDARQAKSEANMIKAAGNEYLDASATSRRE
jgi:succinoglycan biosynthesis transport protein ExoP